MFSCKNNKQSETSIDFKQDLSNTSLVILGNIQDAGSPHIGCEKKCCKNLFNNPDKNRQVISLGLIDGPNNKKYLFEATPDISRQLKVLKNIQPVSKNEMPDGIFITHAHIGHYAGLMYLGKEAKNAQNVTVYAMPKMSDFFKNNGPWNQLISNHNIRLNNIKNEQTVTLTSNIKVIPIIVPHRDEYSETVGFKIIGPNKSALFIPDIDKWEKWKNNIIDEIKQVDYAFLDATFFNEKEINNRNISEIPHPFIIESMEKFKNLTKTEKAKIIFIHFNHTNPVIDPNSEESKMIIANGFQVGRLNNSFEL
ncbi:MBL fold metallo-hydrolase [Tenacibaculum sediminilitoris]|uniref:MBL fold metallo-hydrolase n=1 Tax=Tenacibaculum sediminilitoris TaxID=1820334 RepID=UPI0038B647F3